MTETGVRSGASTTGYDEEGERSAWRTQVY
jgi:hypothetical protein